MGPSNKAMEEEILCLWLVAEREILFCLLLFIENWHLRWSGSKTYLTFQNFEWDEAIQYYLKLFISSVKLCCIMYTVMCSYS